MVDVLDLGRPRAHRRAGFAAQRRFETLHESDGGQFFERRAEDDRAQEVEHTASERGHPKTGTACRLEAARCSISVAEAIGPAGLMRCLPLR